jgi:hypothetical protein
MEIILLMGDFEIGITQLLHCIGSFRPTYSFSAYHVPTWLASAALSHGFLRGRFNSTSIPTYSFIANMRRDERSKNLKNMSLLLGDGTRKEAAGV